MDQHDPIVGGDAAAAIDRLATAPATSDQARPRPTAWEIDRLFSANASPNEERFSLSQADFHRAVGVLLDRYCGGRR